MSRSFQDVRVFDDPEAMSLEAAELIVTSARNAVAKRDRFTLALSGGSTPRRTYELLSEEPFVTAMPWEKTHLLFGDDRAVDADHEHSNFRMAREALIARISIPDCNVHPIPGELGAEHAALAYAERLHQLFQGTPAIDLTMLGMGPDGHTASVFPGSETLKCRQAVCAAPVPDMEPRVERVTLSMDAINASRQVLFLAAGDNKRDKLREIFDNPGLHPIYPAGMITAPTAWFLDRAAAPEPH